MGEPVEALDNMLEVRVGFALTLGSREAGRAELLDHVRDVASDGFLRLEQTAKVGNVLARLRADSFEFGANPVQPLTNDIERTGRRLRTRGIDTKCFGEAATSLP